MNRAPLAWLSGDLHPENFGTFRGGDGAVYFDVAARAPWVAEQPTREMVLPKIIRLHAWETYRCRSARVMPT